MPRAYIESIRMVSGRKHIIAILALASGLGAGLACGQGGSSRPAGTLPKAGSDDDDGTGTLARLSRGQRPRPRPGDPGQQDPYVDPYYGGDWYGYGGDYYGYGGDEY